MKKKILLILTTIILFMLIIVTLTSKASVTIQGKVYSNGGYYDDVFRNQGNKLYDIKWTDVQDKYYTIQYSDDYERNAHHTRDCMCANHSMADGGFSHLIVRAIIDIEGR